MTPFARAITLSLALGACDQGAPSIANRDVPPTSAVSTVPADAGTADAGAADAGALDAGATDAGVAGRPFKLPVNHSDTSNCIKLLLGTAREPATLCDEFGGGIWRLTRQIVRVKRGGKRVVVLDVITKIEGFDTGNTMLESFVSVAADGMSASVLAVPAGTEPRSSLHYGGHTPNQTCAAAPPTAAEEREEAAMYGRPTFGEARSGLCTALGTYRWDNGTFSRVR